MKKLIHFLLVGAIMSLPTFADAPYSGPAPQIHARRVVPSPRVDKRLLSEQHTIRNLRSQVEDLQAFNRDLMLENALIKSNPEKVYIERDKEVVPWWVPFVTTGAFILGVIL